MFQNLGIRRGMDEAETNDQGLKDSTLPQKEGKRESMLSLNNELTLATEQGMAVLIWRHSNERGKESLVKFGLLTTAGLEGKTEGVEQKVSSIIDLYNRDYVRLKAGSPVYSAFFRGMLNRPDVALVALENCAAKNATIRSAAAARNLKLENVSLENCLIEVAAERMQLTSVKFSGSSPIRINCAHSRWQNVQISENCVLSGDLGEGLIEADCEIHCTSVNTDFRRLKFAESPAQKQIIPRMSGMFVTGNLISEEFRVQGNFRDNPEEFERRFQVAKVGLEKSFS